MSSTRLNFIRSPEYPQARARATADGFRRYAKDWPLKHPSITITAEIGPSSPVNAARIERQLAQFAPTAPIDLVIDSPGGNALEARKIYAILRAHRGHVSARVIGQCSSAATVIVLAASWRESVPEAQFLLHQIASDLNQVRDLRLTAKTHARIAQDMSRENASLVSLYAGRTGRPRVLFEAEMATETRISAQRARELGLVHSIIDRDGNEPLAPAPGPI